MKALWLKNALIGINEPTPIVAPDKVGQYLQQLSTQPIEPALAFSQSVGVWAACRLAGIVPKPIVRNDLPEVSSVEAQQAFLPNATARQLLNTVMSKPNARLQHEACTLLVAKELTLPYDLLPLALDAGQRNIALRPCILAAIGLYGQWLARFNSQWRYAASDIEEHVEEGDERLWNEGNMGQREAYFKHCRIHTPEKARELLATQLKDLPAKERLVFVSLMWINLNQNDEIFLTPLLKDRSREVRQTAAMLLAREPESAFSKQLTDWLEVLIYAKKGFIKTTWHCDAPLQAEPAWADAAIEINMPKHSGMGERAWWLYQLVRLTPLSWWTNHTGMTPFELMRWAQQTNWYTALMRGWVESATAQDDVWITTMLEQPANGEFSNYAYREKLLNLLGEIAPEQRQQLWEKLPSSLSECMKQSHLFTQACPLGEFLPEKFSIMAITSIARDYKKGVLKQAYTLRDQYLELAYVVSPKALSHWKSPAADENSNDSLSNAEKEWLNSFEQIIEIRQKLHESMTTV